MGLAGQSWTGKGDTDVWACANSQNCMGKSCAIQFIHIIPWIRLVGSVLFVCFFNHGDEAPEMNNLQEERFVLVYGFRGLSPQSLVPLMVAALCGEQSSNPQRNWETKRK